MLERFSVPFEFNDEMSLLSSMGVESLLQRGESDFLEKVRRGKRV
jgi:hypothetical protein